MAERTQATTIMEKLENLIGEEGLRTELNITLTTATLVKLMVAMILSILVSYMVIMAIGKAIGKGAKK